MSEETKDVKDIKITTVEKVKDPKRVEAGKKLAAMSKQAKEKKAAHNNTTLKEVVTDEFSFPNVDPLVAVGVVGLAGLVVYYKFIKKSPATQQSIENSEPSTSEANKSVKPKENTQNTQPKPKRVYRELDTLG